MLVAQAASAGMSHGANSIGDNVLLIATVLGWSLGPDAIAYRWPRLATLIKSRPEALIVDGRVNERHFAAN